MNPIEKEKQSLEKTMSTLIRNCLFLERPRAELEKDVTVLNSLSRDYLRTFPTENKKYDFN